MTGIDKWQNLNLEAQLNKTAELAIRDAQELEQYRSTNLNPVQIRALVNLLAAMRAFMERVDKDVYAPMPATHFADMAQFWEEEWDK